MAHPLSVRLDQEALHALNRLEATGLSRSEAVRAALVETASRLQNMQALADEVEALEADEDDLVETTAVAQMMEQLRAPG